MGDSPATKVLNPESLCTTPNIPSPPAFLFSLPPPMVRLPVCYSALLEKALCSENHGFQSYH